MDLPGDLATKLAEIGNGYGSECHMLRNLGRHRELLDFAVREAVGCQAVRWRDLPFDRKSAWKDGEWKGLDFLAADSPARRTWTKF